MSLASVHPAEMRPLGHLGPRSLSVDELVAEHGLSCETVLSIEQLRSHIHSCFACGVSWAQQHVSLDCSECGGYAMERPCPRCEGQCGKVWKRDLTMSHACGKARWAGSCGLSASPAPPASLADLYKAPSNA